MIAKYTVKIDVTKLDKSKFREYTLKDGHKVVEASVDVVIMDENKHAVVVKVDGTPIQGDGWRLEKVGFSVETQSKEEKDSKAESNFLGDTQQFKNTGDSQVSKQVAPADSSQIEYPEDEINPDDIPF